MERETDIYALLLRIPHYRTRIYLADLWLHWKDFFEVVNDARWELKLKRAHRLDWFAKRCSCGENFGEHYHDDTWDNHKQAARDEMWDKRWEDSKR